LGRPLAGRHPHRGLPPHLGARRRVARERRRVGIQPVAGRARRRRRRADAEGPRFLRRWLDRLGSCRWATHPGLAVTGAALLLKPRAAPSPPRLLRRFSVWCGSSIGANRRTAADLADGAVSLLPAGHWDEVEVLVKAGEGGSYQAEWLHPTWGDPHPLAIDSPDKLGQLIAQCRPLGVRITPYVVVRFRPSWLLDEQAMIRQLVRIAGRCVLNV